jgi:hypothetical protein
MKIDVMPVMEKDADTPARPSAAHDLSRELLRVFARAAIEARKARAEVARQYCKSTPPPKPTPRNEDAVATSKTKASTIEALLYELRNGLSCLADEGARIDSGLATKLQYEPSPRN